VFVELVRGAPPLAAASDVHGPKMSGATALTMSHGLSPSGTPTLSVISTSPLALAAATTTTLLAVQVAVAPGLLIDDESPAAVAACRAASRAASRAAVSTTFADSKGGTRCKISHGGNCPRR
jgi:hypothetical protein